MKRLFLGGLMLSIVQRSRIQSLCYAGGIFCWLYTLTNLYADKYNTIQPLANIAISLDKSITFIAPMILIYACSLPLFVLSFFVINIQDLGRLTHRLILATLIACLIFYGCPLIISKSPVDFYFWGIDWKWIYSILYQIDKPYNQLPSLHVAYASIIGYSLIKTSQSWKIWICFLFYILCILIALSTVFTWQHHSLDVLAGLILVCAICYIERYFFLRYSSLLKSHIIKYITISCVWFLSWQILPILIFSYPINLLGKIIFSIIAYWGLVVFLMIACIYHLHQYSINHDLLINYFKKNQGKLTVSRLIYFYPMVLIYFLIWQLACITRFCKIQKIPIILKYKQQKIELISTGKLTKYQLNPLIKNKKHIIYIDMTIELSSSLFLFDSYYYFPMMDLIEYDSQENRLFGYCQVIENHLLSMPKEHTVLIICQCIMGRTRSVAMMACLMAYLGGLSPKIINEQLKIVCPKHLATRYLSDGLLYNLAQQRNK